MFRLEGQPEHQFVCVDAGRVFRNSEPVCRVVAPLWQQTLVGLRRLATGAVAPDGRSPCAGRQEPVLGRQESLHRMARADAAAGRNRCTRAAESAGSGSMTAAPGAGAVAPGRQEMLLRGRCVGRQQPLRLVSPGGTCAGRHELLRMAAGAPAPGGRRRCCGQQQPPRRAAGAQAPGGRVNCRCVRGQEPLRWGGRRSCVGRQELLRRAAGSHASVVGVHTRGLVSVFHTRWFVVACLGVRA